MHYIGGRNTYVSLQGNIKSHDYQVRKYNLEVTNKTNEMGNFAQRDKAMKIAKAVTLCKVGAIYERVVVKVVIRDTLPLYFKVTTK